MKVAFCTCVQIGLSCIEAIHEIGGEFDLFISLKDEKAKKKSGRIYLDSVADQHNVPLLKINHINDPEVLDALAEHNIDWLFIIGWSQIASKDVIEAPNRGAVGAHPTLLPLGRGRAAIPWAIIKGLDKTGVSFFKMDEGVDTGEILGQFEIPIADDETATKLYDKVNDAHTDLIKQIWPSIQDDSLKGEVQDESMATYWEGRKPEHGLIHPDLTILEVDRLVRATTHPYPGAFVVKENGQKIIIWSGSRIVKSDFSIPCTDGEYYALEYEVVNE